MQNISNLTIATVYQYNSLLHKLDKKIIKSTKMLNLNKNINISVHDYNKKYLFDGVIEAGLLKRN